MRLQRARVNGETAERVVLPGIDRLIARQCGPQRPQRIVAAGTAIVERCAEKVELLLERADPDAEDHPAATDVIQCAVTLYDRQRMMVAEHQRHGGEPDLFGARRHIAERGERIPVPRTAPPGLGRGQADVLAAGQMVIAEPIRRLGDAADVLDRGVLLPRQWRSRRRW